MNCSVVIRAYNEEKHIGRLLEGIDRQTIRDVELILVDSGSTDETVHVAESFGARIVHIPPAEFTFGARSTLVSRRRHGNGSSLPARMSILSIPIG